MAPCTSGQRERDTIESSSHAAERTTLIAAVLKLDFGIRHVDTQHAILNLILSDPLSVLVDAGLHPHGYALHLAGMAVCAIYVKMKGQLILPNRTKLETIFCFYRIVFLGLRVEDDVLVCVWG